MKALLLSTVLSAGMLLPAGPAAAQAAEESAEAPANGNEIVVSARRRDEALQEVPQTINVVTAEQIEKLNLRNFTDIQTLVPGLTLSGGGSFSTSATVRGVAFNPEASGNNATVEFYLNEAPISSNFLFQSSFDVGQFELLRGPQGTLRGRASPSGSITVTTRKPNLQKAGVSFSATATDTHAYKGDFALNVPVIGDVLGVRLAGVIDENQGNQIHSIKEDGNYTPAPFRKTKGLRASARFEPVDFASFNFMYQTLRSRQVQFSSVESASFVTGNPPVATPVIDPFDRLSLEDSGSRQGQDQQIYVWSGELRFAGQKLSYTGSHNHQDFLSLAASDGADYFGPPRFQLVERTFRDPTGYEAVCSEQSLRANLTPTNQAYFQCTHGSASRNSHEFRLSSDERVLGVFDYVAGFLYDRNITLSRLTQETPLMNSAGTAVSSINLTSIVRDANSTEKSWFGNVIAHIGERAEVSGGLRHINYRNFSSFLQNGNRTIPDRNNTVEATVWSGSAKYRFSEDLMVYGTVGTSWRPGAFAIGDFNLQPTGRERSFFDLPPEKSTSYEIGVKTSFLDKRGRFNVSLYKQDYDNYVYRGNSVYFINYSLQGGVVRSSVSSFNFVAAVPATVKGVEVEGAFQITPRWSVSSNFSYADGQIKNGTIACNDINADGKPDTNAALPTVAALQAAVGPGENVAQCAYSGRTLTSPKWSANMQSEYNFPVFDTAGGFVRALVNYTPRNEGDPNNTNDDVSAYALANVYAGIRASDGSWELQAFAKNVFNTRRILSQGGAPLSSAIRTTAGGTINYVSDYYSVSVNSPREVGISLRLAIGSR